MKKKIIIVTGDPVSINSEIIFKCWRKLNNSIKNKIYFISNKKLLESQFKKLKYSINVETVTKHNKRIQINAGPVDYSHRADLYFYLGKYREALSDINKAIILQDDYSMKMYDLEMRSKIKYMLGDYNGAIKDLEDHNRYFSSRNYSCGIYDYYWFAVYFLAIEDYSNASNYLNRIRSYPNNDSNCGNTIKMKSKAQVLRDYLN